MQNEYRFRLQGIHCANCMSKVENELKRLDGVKKASVDFSLGRVVLGSERELNLEEVKAAVVRIEPHVKVFEDEPYAPQNRSKAQSKSLLFEDTLISAIRSPRFLSFAFGAILFFFALLLGDSLALYVLAYLLIGGEVLLFALKNIARREIFDENFLMGIATIGAFVIGEYPEAVAVMFFYRVGEFFQSLAVERSRKSITSLLHIRPEFARIENDGTVCEIPPSEVPLGSVIIIRAGERVPLDGIVLSGSSSLDLSALNGESLPKDVNAGDEILSGAINKQGTLRVQTTKIFQESTIAKILDLVQNASSKKAKTEQFITKFARYYTPAVVFFALLLALIPPLFVEGASFEAWLARALVFLVVSCPCALVISIPLGFFAGIGKASKEGILIKGGNFLEALQEVDTLVFDKTGTLSKGVFEVARIDALKGSSKEEVLRLAALSESHSNHPIARSIQRAFGEEVKCEIAEYTEHSGYGVSAMIGGAHVLCGSAKLMEEQGVAYEITQATLGESVVYVARDGVLLGNICLRDEIKDGAKSAVDSLKRMGIARFLVLSGDKNESVKQVATALGIAYKAELLPHQKVEELERITKAGAKAAFIGDGINDAPSLAISHVGIAMGAMGSDAAIEASDVVIMNDEIGKVATAIKIAKNTHAVVWQNIIFALGVKGAILIMGAMGIATMWEAVFGDVGVALIAVLNASRVLKSETSPEVR